MIIVGLGNIGEEYENTFHNLGFMFVDAFAKRKNVKIDKAECDALTGVFSVNGKRVVLAKPTTYMNLSGRAVKSLIGKYNDDVLIVFDDFDLPKFTARVKPSGSGGSHNGMKNVVETLGTKDVKRMRLGFSKRDYDVRGYVLGKIPENERADFAVTFEKCADAVDAYLLDGDFNKLMKTLN